MKKNTTKVIKEANKYLVMQCIQAFEPVTLEKIAEKTLLSRPTILEIINSFKEEGIVVNGGFRESTGGRPPQLLCINGDSAYAIGIDFEFPTIRIALANAKREIVGRRKILFKIDTQAEEVFGAVLRELEHLLEEFFLCTVQDRRDRCRDLRNDSKDRRQIPAHHENPGLGAC